MASRSDEKRGHTGNVGIELRSRAKERANTEARSLQGFAAAQVREGVSFSALPC